MSGAPARGTVPRRQRRHHHHHHHDHHHHKHQKQVRDVREREESEEPEEKRPKVNPIFLWASQREQRIVEVRCEDYDKRNRIKLTKTAQGWRSIPRTASNMYSIGLGMNTQTTNNGNSSNSSSGIGEEKDGKKSTERLTLNLQSVSAKQLTNGLVGRDSIGKKRSYDEIDGKSKRDYDSLVNDKRNKENGKMGRSWDEERRRIPCSDDEDDNEEEDEGDEEEEEEDDDDEREGGEEVDENENEMEIENRFKKEVTRCSGSDLERLQKDKLFQPRVLLEQLRFSQLPEGVHHNVLHQRQGKSKKEQNDHDVIGVEKMAVIDNEKKRRTNKAAIQDILNMIDATAASPVLATDTPTADLPVDSTKTYEVLNGNDPLVKSIEGKVKDSNSIVLMELSNKVTSQSRMDIVSSYRYDSMVKTNDDLVDDKIEVHEEKILTKYDTDQLEERESDIKDDVVIVSVKTNNTTSNSRSCKIVEADGGLGSQPKHKTNSQCKRKIVISPEDDTRLDAEEERPDEPGDPMKIDYTDSSTILNALRNTPGLSVSITKTHASESTKNTMIPLTRSTSKASSSSRSPDSQAECVERLMKNADSATEIRTPTTTSKNLPGLSIIIPSYRYRASQTNVTHSTTSPNNTKTRVESPESTVNFLPKNDAYGNETKIVRFPREQDDEERELDEDEDDCDSQVLEDLRRQKADSFVAHEMDYFHRQSTRNSEERKTPLENAKNQTHWISSSRSSEAQAKCKYQDVEHFDEQVLEELRTRGTVVSPQPSGIPCSPASRRPSSAYLERLLPSPPCSVTCSEDAKNDLTLKGILSSPNQFEARDYEKQKDISTRCEQVPSDHLPVRVDHAREIERNRKGSRNVQERLTVHSQEMRNSCRPMSSGDIHSTYLVTDRATPKRPMSAEWSVLKARSQSNPYQKSSRKLQAHVAEETCATSSSTDKLLDPASQLRELIETSGHLIPDPLLVPRDYLPGLAAAPATEIPKLLTSRPELRLPEALTRPDLLRDPDLLVISLAHLQHVLDHGEGPISRSRMSQQRVNNGINRGHASNGAKGSLQTRHKLSCKPIGTLMPAPIDLSNGRRTSPYPPLLRVRSGLLKQEPEVTSTATSPDESQLWHPLFGSQKRQQQQQQQQHHQSQHYGHQKQQHYQHDQQQQQSQQQQQQQQQRQHSSWHRTTLAS